MIAFYKISAKHLLKSFYFIFLMLVLIPGLLAQESVVHNEQDLKQQELLKANATPDKSTPIMLNVVGGGALIDGLTVGKGGGNRSNNSAFGIDALRNNTLGEFNTGLGSLALAANTTGNCNTAIGRVALFLNKTGSSNTAIGYNSLFYNIEGNENTAIGRAALYDNTKGSSNTAIGRSALLKNVANHRSTAIGFGAMHFADDDPIGRETFNTAVGYHALRGSNFAEDNIGQHNTAIGDQALLSNTSGSWNTAIGSDALRANTTGTHNTAVGRRALYVLNSGNRNTSLGWNAGGHYTDITRGTFLGVDARPNANGLSNITGIGYFATPTASNSVRIGNAAVTSIGGNANWTNFSDGGFKSNVSEEVAGLGFILRLRPVSYNLDVHKLAADLGEDATHDEEGNKIMATPDEITLKSRDEKAAIRYTGFIAQEVEATVNELGVAFSGVDAPPNKSSYYGLRYAEFVVPLVRAVQEQQAQIELLEPAAVEALQLEVQALRAENEFMKDQLSQILSLLKEQGIDLGSGSTGNPSRGSGRSQSNAYGNSAQLEQNTPNPFQENTSIRYFLPEKAGKAQIVITDLQGNRIQSLDIGGSGFGEVTINGGSLAPGTYVYSLVIGGQLTDSKRMVLL